MSQSSKTALIAGISGTTLQWYDFSLYGYFAPIIAMTFFPSDDRFASHLSTFGIFAVGYLLAPLGAIVFGTIGDYYGRKRALTISILSMAIPTAAIAFIPSYHVIGIAAPILMTLFRVAQGFVASAEFTGSAIFLVEHAAPDRKAFYGCLTSCAYSAGSILAGLISALLAASFMPSWGWRIGFLLSLIGGILIFYLRTRVHETPEFLELPEQEKLRMPFLIAFRENPIAMIGVICVIWLGGIITFGTTVFAETYLHEYSHLSVSIATLIITLTLTVDAILEPFIAILADKIGLLKVTAAGMLLILLLSVPVFMALSSGNIALICVAMVIMAILIAIVYAPLNAYMVSLFPREYRYSGFGMAFVISITLFGSTTPFVMLWLIQKTQNVLAPSWYYLIGAIIGLIGLSLCEFSRRKNTKSLDTHLLQLDS